MSKKPPTLRKWEIVNTKSDFYQFSQTWGPLKHLKGHWVYQSVVYKIISQEVIPWRPRTLYPRIRLRTPDSILHCLNRHWLAPYFVTMIMDEQKTHVKWLFKKNVLINVIYVKFSCEFYILCKGFGLLEYFQIVLKHAFIKFVLAF